MREYTDKEWSKIFGENFRNIIKQKGYTQEQLANAIGVSRVMINRYITGKAAPSIFVLRRIVKLLNCSMDDFFYRNY